MRALLAFYSDSGHTKQAIDMIAATCDWGGKRWPAFRSELTN